jgi:hypothetical protein
MPFNGSGSFIPLSSPTYPAVADQPIYASQFNDNISDIHSGLSGCVTRDGQTTITANLPMAGFKLTSLGDGSSSGHALVYGQATAASLGGALAITGALSGVTTLAASGNATIGGTLGVTGAATLSSTLGVTGVSTLAALAATTGTFSSTLAVTGAATFSSTLGTSDKLSVLKAGTAYSNGLQLESGAANTGEYSPALTFSASNVSSAIYSTRLSSFGGVLNFATQGTGGGDPVSRMTIDQIGDVNSRGVAVSRYKTSSTARSSTTTPTDDPDLVVPLGFGTWAIDLWLTWWCTSSAAGGTKGGLAFSGTTTDSKINSLTYNAAIGGLTSGLTSAISTGLLTGLTPGTSSGSPEWVNVKGFITVTVAGNLSLQWAQNSSNSSALNIGAGSYLSCTKLS